MFTVIVNLKTYPETIGNNSKTFMGKISKIQKPGYELKIAPPFTSLHYSSIYEEIIAQHVDHQSPGPYTGSVLIEDLMENGIRASLLNHSERRVGLDNAIKTLKRATDLGFTLYICCETLEEIEKLSINGAGYIAYEPKELIGGNISVSTAKPEIIQKGADICKDHGSILLVGAGVKNSDDVRVSKSLGAGGILIASGIVKAKDPLYTLNSLMI